MPSVREERDRDLLYSGFAYVLLLDIFEGQTQSRQEAPSGSRGQAATSEEADATLAFIYAQK